MLFVYFNNIMAITFTPFSLLAFFVVVIQTWIVYQRFFILAIFPAVAYPICFDSSKE